MRRPRQVSVPEGSTIFFWYDQFAINSAPPSTVRNQLFALCALSFLLLIPFVNKPFHIDDPLYVWTAQQIRFHPLDFHGFHLNWQGHDQPVTGFFENPPLTSYLLAAVSMVAGFSRVAFHLTVLIFDLLSIVGTYLLAARFCTRPLLAALLLLICPAFFVSATTLMCEPLMICFWIWSVYFWVISDDNATYCIWISAVIILAAVLTKFMAVCIVPLLILHWIFHPVSIRKTLIQGFALALPILGAIGYEIFTIHYYGVGGFSGAARYVAAYHDLIAPPPAVKIMNTLCFLGGCAAGCVALLPIIFDRRVTLISICIILVLTFISASSFLAPADWSSPPTPGSSTTQQTFASGVGFFIQVMFWLAGGLGLLSVAIFRVIRKGKNVDEIFLFVWIAGIFIFTCFVNWSINARSLLPLVPPTCILVTRALDYKPTLPRALMITLLSIATALGFAVTWSDYNLASTIELAAHDLPAIARRDLLPSKSLWFTGHWGFQYYIEKSGALPVDDLSPKFNLGDVVIYPASSYGGTPGSGGYAFIRRTNVGSTQWVSTAHPNIGAEFYCSYGYGLPFVFGPIPPEAFDVVRVTPNTRVHPF